MIKYFGRAFKITNENIILTTPFVLFLFLFGIYFGVSQNLPKNYYTGALLIGTVLFMFSAFFAGWFYMVKKAIDLDKKEFIVEEEKAKASFGLIKELPVGIGEFFFSFVVGLVLYVLLMSLISFLTYKIGMNFIGKVDLDVLEFKMALNSPVAMKSLVSSLPMEQLVKLNAWNMLILFSMTFFSFITMFWAAQIVIGEKGIPTKNSFIAFFKAIKFQFKNLLSVLILFVYVSMVNFLVSLVNTIFAVNQILYFISMIIYFYFVVYVVVLVFLYYDSENNPSIKEKVDYVISDEITDIGDSGSDSVGQERSGDTDSEGD